ncbi:hypothetical protein [Comamonas sp. NoAH]|uniref:hypothetical protein n=1 Tax=Comamonas halotolerans TaxID=3041496 RepID=UPI0024E0A9B3|nr:hypothetical protein [Comamonas sp. NoAH]
MRSRLKTFASWSVLVLVIWGVVGAVWYWRSHEPSTGDLALGLLGVPLMLIAGYVVLKHVLGHVLQAPALAQSGEASGAGSVTPREVEDRQKHSTPMQLFVMGSSVKMPAGQTQELLQACMEEVRPDLDGELCNDQGFPVMAARVAELDDIDALQWWDGLELDAELPSGRAWVAQLTASKAREMRLLASVLAECAEAVERDILLHARQNSSSKAKAVFPALQVRLATAAGWDAGDLQHLQSWAQHWLKRSAPALRFDVRHYSPQSDVNFPWPSALLEAKDAVFQPSESDVFGGGEIWLLAAAHSEIDQSEVDRLAVSGQLYGPKYRNGRIVGEGAAAVTFLRHQVAKGVPAASPKHRELAVVADAKLASIAANSSQAIETMTVPMLEGCGVISADIGRLFCDADHREAPLKGIALLLGQHFPDLSLESDCFPVGIANGNTGAVGALTSLILAAEYAVQEQRAALALALASEPWRAAALLMPPGWGSDTGTEAA